MENINKIFWDYITDSGIDCNNINKVRKEYKKLYGKDLLEKIDREYTKYDSLLRSKLDPILNDSYDFENENYDNFFHHILSKGKENFNKIKNTSYKAKYQILNQDYYDIKYPIIDTLYDKASEYQHLKVIKTKLGNVLMIDNDMQFSDLDEHIYHEMITHVPINYFNGNINMLIIGGGDGGVAREALKHKNVIKVTMVEIDKEVVEVSKEFFPNISSEFNNPKLDLKIMDGLKFVEEYNGPKFDIIILDLTDFGQSNPLHTLDFYRKLKNILKDDKSLISFNLDNFDKQESDQVYLRLKELKREFKHVSPFGAFIPTFGGSYYSFCLVSDTINYTDNIDWNFFESKNIEMKYYTQNIHLSSFNYPKNIESKLKSINELQSSQNTFNQSTGFNQSTEFKSISSPINNNILNYKIKINNLDYKYFSMSNENGIQSIIDNFIKNLLIDIKNTQKINNNHIIIIFEYGQLTIYINKEKKYVYMDLLLTDKIIKENIDKSIINLSNSLLDIDINIKIDITKDE